MPNISDIIFDGDKKNISWNIGASYRVMLPTTDEFIVVNEFTFLNRDQDRILDLTQYLDLAYHCVASGLITAANLSYGIRDSNPVNFNFKRLYSYQSAEVNPLLNTRLESNEIIMTRIR